MSLKELLCQLSGFLKPCMDRAVDDPLYRMHHGRNTFTLEVNWAYSTSAQKTTKKKITPVTQIQDGCRLSRRIRRRRERKKAARALQRTTTAKSPIVVSSDGSPPAETPPPTSTPMEQKTTDTLPPRDKEPPPPPAKKARKQRDYGQLICVKWKHDVKVPKLRSYGLTTFVNHKHQMDLNFLANKKEVNFITTLRNVSTAVAVGSTPLTTYKMMDETNARLYVRAVGGDEKTLREVAEVIRENLHQEPGAKPATIPMV